MASWPELLIDIVPFTLILGGFASASWLLERSIGHSPIVGKPLRWFAKVASSLGLFIGILLMATGVIVWWIQPTIGSDSITQLLLIVTGIALFLKPIKDVRWASLIGLTAGCLCVGYVYMFHRLPETFFGIQSRWIYVVVFLLPGLVVYLLFKFVEDLLSFIGSVLSFKLTAITLGLLCIVQGLLLFFDRSLYEVFQI
ncbi:MAG: hypothetical protein JSV85_04770 [Candidatus Bathyarchaeota archaeon]|nr:MAG: hypothetical protein JSV85_04770 [Candidatus Bathyarchaeota archaeon]